MSYKRFIALGDSMTEGMSDEIVAGNYRGWADRVADVMARHWEGFTYANLAVRGKLVGQVLEEQIPVATPFIEGSSTLVSYHAGANDVIRWNYDPTKTIDTYNRGLEQLMRTGATLMLFCVLEDTGQKSKRALMWKERFEIFNANVRKRASQINAMLFDPNGHDFWRDQRFIDADRLHLNAEGHRRVAQAVLARFNLPHDQDWNKPLPPAPPKDRSQQIREDAKWVRDFAVPWVIRRARGRSSGDGRSPKYPVPITWPR
ncbi:MAG: SGNH/GDSL hydrolase family protein [Actinomycetales bacterium]|jgi:lysophospholipase L1-like esterase|nr:SGNH/GDSL hydrolase family protein [Actinomycetales bacterium]